MACQSCEIVRRAAAFNCGRNAGSAVRLMDADQCNEVFAAAAHQRRQLPCKRPPPAPLPPLHGFVHPPHPSAIHSRATTMLRPCGSLQQQRPVPRRHSSSSSSSSNSAVRAATSTLLTTSSGGLLAEPGLSSPAAFTQRWRSAVRRRLDGLHGSLQRTSQPERLLAGLDELLQLLRSWRALGTHVQQQHADAGWASAGASVAADCSKYWAHLLRDKRLAAKLQRAQAQLAAAAAAGSDDSGGGGGAAQQARLASLLAAALSQGPAEDGLGWMAALELPDANAEQLAQLEQQEEQLIAAIDAALQQPAVLQLPAPLSELLPQQPPAGSTDEPGDASSSGVNSGDASSSGAAPLEPQLVRASKALLAQLLTRASSSRVRQLAFVGGLQPALAEATRLLDRLARCRQQQAWLRGHSCYQDAVSSSLAAGNSGAGFDAAEFLVQLAEVLQPLAEQQVQWIMQQAKQQEQQESWQAWDWDWLLHTAQQPQVQALRDPQLQQHMQLDAVLTGFSGLLQQLAGVQLLPRPACEAEVWQAHVRVLMVVRQPSQQAQQQHPSHQQAPELLGTLYVDVGGGYGTRQLRYTRQQEAAAAGAGSSKQGGSSDEPWQQQLMQQSQAAAAVAVGIGGSRLHSADRTVAAGAVQQQQQRQQQPEDSGSGSSSSKGALLLSVPQLWELGHELGHALHLILSSRQPAAQLCGRFLPPALLEVPPQLMECLLLRPAVLSRVCRHHASGAPLPGSLASALARHYGMRYNSALALCARIAAGLSELMVGQAQADGEGQGAWRAAWQAVSGLPPGVAVAGCLREVALLPVMAAHRGSYHSYLTAWHIAAGLAEAVFEPLLAADGGDSQRTVALRQAAAAVLSMHAGQDAEGLLQQLLPGGLAPAPAAVDAAAVARWTWRPPEER